MLTYAEIEGRLGVSTVRSIDAAIAAGFAVAERSSDPEEGLEAMRYLLLSMLAAASVMPPQGANERAGHLAEELVELVAAARSGRS